MEVEPALPRICCYQRYSNNMPSGTPSEYYRRIISIPPIDHLLSEMASRFTVHHQTALNGMCLMPSLATLSFPEVKDKALKFADMYKDDLPSLDSVPGEIHSCKIKWQQHMETHGKASLPACPVSALQHSSRMFVNIHSLLKILCTLPVTSCSSERSHSSLKLIITSMRSTIGNERLSGLALHIHRAIQIDISDVIEELS